LWAHLGRIRARLQPRREPLQAREPVAIFARRQLGGARGRSLHEVGHPDADLSFVDLDQTWKIDRFQLHSKNKVTPFHEWEGKEYRPERLLQPEDVAAIVVAALDLPRTAEVTDIAIRAMTKP
jgi:hypothetical protein